MQEQTPQIETDVERMVSTWRHFKPCGLIFVSTCQEDVGTYDLTAASDIGASETALYNCLLQVGEVGMTFNRLRCVRNERELSSFDECFVTKVSVRAIDSTLTGSPSQDAETLAAIEESLISPNDAYVQSRFRLGEIGGWQPNFFNLSIKTRGNHTIMNGFQDSNYSVQHAGDLSIGVMLPYVFEPRFPISIGKVPDDAFGYIVVRGSCAQLVQVGSAHVKQPYPLIVEVELLGYNK